MRQEVRNIIKAALDRLLVDDHGTAITLLECVLKIDGRNDSRPQPTRTPVRQQLNAKGEPRSRRKSFTATEVREVRRMRKSGMLLHEIASQFGASESMVARVFNPRKRKADSE